jgi:hypothetical protein
MDDLPQLKALWDAAGFTTAILEKQFTDFQVAADSHGVIVGAIAIQIAAAHGRIHSESYTDFALCDSLRPLFWERFQRIAASHGLFRLWTTETALFWKKDVGFAAATSQPPDIFGVQENAWLTLRLRDEEAAPDLLEAQFVQFRDAERARREQWLHSATVIRVAATILASLILIVCLAMLFWLVHKHYQR